MTGKKTLAELILMLQSQGMYTFDWSNEATADRKCNKIIMVADNSIKMLRHHGLDYWTFKFDENVRSRFGLCNYRERTISVTYDYVYTHHTDELQDTISHEIAHAIVGEYLLNGTQVHHGIEWQTVAKFVGSSGKRCSLRTKLDDQIQLTSLEKFKALT